MSLKRKSKPQKEEKEHIEGAISEDLTENRNRVDNVFSNCTDLIVLPWRYGPELQHTAFSVYFDSLINKTENYMKYSLQDLAPYEIGPATLIKPEEIKWFFEHHGVSEKSAKVIDDFNQAADKILCGNIVIFFDGWNKALSYLGVKMDSRAITEPINEPAVQGPREGAVESLDTNIGMIRKRVKSTKLKFESFIAGKESQTKVVYSYMEGLVDPQTLNEFKVRIVNIDREEILDTSFIEALIEDSTYSPFPQHRYTERPDTSAAALLSGKILVLVEGSPSILICPALFVEFFTTGEDYYQRIAHATIIRFLRIGAFTMALTLPSIYIALSTFHPELIPTVLLIAIVNEREGIPFPAVVEALLMEFFFELLREAGIRLPKPVGSAVSIVGALVIGQAAIQAKIASPMMVIIVAATGIASFAIPQYNMAIALRIVRFPLMLLAATLGGFGIMIGGILILLHLISLRTLGQPYLSPLAPLEFRQLRDVFVRAPMSILLRHPRNRNNGKGPRL